MNNKNINVNLDELKTIEGYKPKKKILKKKLGFSDIETIIVNNYHKLVCISLVTDNYKISFNNIDDYFKYIFKNNKNFIIYFHNFGRFDSTFIMNYIVKNKYVGSVKVIERNNIIYQVTLKNYDIIFRDSYLMIPMKLDDIGNNFCENFKKDNEFEYSDMESMDYNQIKEQCENDCEVLREGFLKFRKIIMDVFEIDIKSQITIPSLSFNIFKKNYYNVYMTPITKNPFKEDEFIRRSYKGGIAEVVKPLLKDGFCYDANSLYPSIMRNEKFPIGKGKFVKGKDIDINNFIGFIECEVETNENLDFLTYRHPDRGLITPKGSWIDVYHHKEVLKAISLGYKIKFIKGFKYMKEEKIFKKFVEEIYDMRIKSETREMNYIMKLILNSLYGRFGMKVLVESTKYINVEELNDYKKKYLIKNIEHLGNNMYIVTGLIKSKDNKELYKNTIDTETAVQIASCITSYSRIFMYEFKKINGNECYYTDTDSIFVKNKLSDEFIGKNLGQFKKEYDVKEGYFIAPKVYCIIKYDGSIKTVLKGVRKDEFKKSEIVSLFKNIINNNDENKSLIIKRINNFKRFFSRVLIGRVETNLKLDFPFNKRKKIIKNGKWVDTEPIRIRFK